MIPIRLELTNFLAYRNPAPLDFTGIHVAVLTGENGAGKSSLLDAITWTLWGRARAKTDAELVHQGQSEMRVAFTFALRDQRYRVTRAKRAKGGGGLLTFEASDEKGKWYSIGEATIPKTQDKITRVLRLTYDTFVNSAYLMQGKADEFTGKKATERKQVLADILGLQQWDEYEDRAKDRLKHIEIEAVGLEAVLREIEAELARRVDYEHELVEAQARALEVNTRLREAEAGWAAIDQARQKMITLDRMADDLTRRIRDTEHELNTLIAELKEAQSRADTVSILSQMEAAQSRLAKLDELDEQREQMSVARQQSGERAAELRGQNESAEAEANGLKKRLETLNADLALARKRTTEAATAEQNKLNQRMVTLQTTTDPRCPTCGQPLTDEARLQLIGGLNVEIDARDAHLQTELAELEAGRTQSATELNNDIETRREQYRQNQVLLKRLADEQATLDKSLKQMSDDVRERPVFVKLLAELQSALVNAGEAKVRIATLVERLARWQNALDLDREQRLKLNVEADQYTAILRDSAARQTALDRLRQEDSVVKAQVMAAQQKLAALEGQIKQREAKRARHNQLADERGLYLELREAFGKKGVPALMIEAAVPEIESTANALLTRMTSGRMNVRFNTQKETQAGDVRETLDIQISDELGTRAYESYSIDGCEPVYIRRNGRVTSLPIQDLWQTDQATHKVGDYETQAVNFEALCYQDGRAVWLPTESILRHPAPEKMLRVKVSPGNYCVTITACHSVFVMTPEGLQVKRGDELRPGDWMLTPRCIARSTPQAQLDLRELISSDFIERRSQVNKSLHWDEHTIWSRRDQTINRYVPNDKDLAEFLGLAVAEASGRKALTVAAGNNREMAERVVALANRLLGVSRTTLAEVTAEAMARYVAHAPGISSQTPKEQYRPVIGGRLVAHIVGNLIGQGARYKHIPPNVFNASPEAQRAFLKALILGDGNLRIRPAKSQLEVGITTISSQLVADTVFLCRQLGIWARVEKHDEAGLRRGMQHQKSYRIAISGQLNLAPLFGELPGVRSPNQTNFDGLPLPLLGLERHNGQKRLRRAMSDQRFECGMPLVPKRSREQYERLLHWLDDWAVVEVASVESLPPQSPYVYDLVVPDNHSFVAGTGLILVHNSGGEQFRVNFAIRVALSQLLARRAGTQMRTLIVDEGFGALDASGRERLVEAINAAQRDFERILVVTHIDELKDLFPTRIEITKSPRGSEIMVV